MATDVTTFLSPFGKLDMAISTNVLEIWGSPHDFTFFGDEK